MADNTTPVDPLSGTTPANPVDSVRNVDIPTMSLDKTLPRQISTGDLRGTQNITGQQTLSDPVSRNIVISSSGPNQQQLFTDPVTNINYMVQGKLGEQSYGIKVAKPGIDVLTATDQQLIFNSNQNVLKIVKTDIVTVNFPAAQFSTIIIPHGLNFVPIPLGFLQYTNSVTNGFAYTALPTYFSFTLDTVGQQVKWQNYLEIDADGTNIIFACNNASASSIPDHKVKYYLLQESAN